MSEPGDGVALFEIPERFHFVDLLGLHLRARLDIPENRGLLLLIWRLSGIGLPSLTLYPPPVIECLRDEMHRQHPWLARLQLPRAAFGPDRVDWAAFWVWVDVVQRRTCRALDIEPDAFPIEGIDPGKLPTHGTIIIISDPGDDEA
jgi:hypothetical protein